MQYDVYGVGNALVDIQARISDATLEKLGYAKGIMTLVDEEAQQKVLGELDGAPLSQCAGGSAANTILGIADFGGKAAYAGKVGSDMLGEFDLADMRKLGVTIEVPPAAEGQTGTCVVLITDDAQRTMLTNLGVSATLSVEDINEEHINTGITAGVKGIFADQRLAPSSPHICKGYCDVGFHRVK